MKKGGCGCASLAPAGYLQSSERHNGERWQCPRCLQPYILTFDEWIAVTGRGKAKPSLRSPVRGRVIETITKEDYQTMKTRPPAAPSTALATLPNGLPFEEAEWAAMSETEKQDALAFFREETAATTEGLQVTFPRVKFPTSGSSFFELPSITGEPEAVREIEGTIVFKQNVRAWWMGEDGETSFTVTNSPPACASFDGVKPNAGEHRQAENCAGCPRAQWDTGKEGHGQACKARLNVFILRPDEEIPTLISIPPTALKLFSKYAVGLRQKKSALIATTTVFGLQDQTSSGGTAYKGLTLRMGKPLTFADMKAARAVSDAFASAMTQRGIQVDEAAGEEPMEEAS
jgi:hypothetical protein